MYTSVCPHCGELVEMASEWTVICPSCGRDPDASNAGDPPGFVDEPIYWLGPVPAATAIASPSPVATGEQRGIRRAALSRG